MKNLKEAKCACEKEKRKAEERWKPARRRWFNVGC
jgi:general stress protein 26